uniref:Uncharacterized protein n=1 Tax=Arundo donax TaxID=35708 RepID=A0A0A9GI63_ARUDO
MPTRNLPKSILSNESACALKIAPIINGILSI